MDVNPKGNFSVTNKRMANVRKISVMVAGLIKYLPISLLLVKK
jgi:hypothetical protein